MATITRQLLMDIPPELRNEIYSHISAPDSGALPTITGLPLKLKTFSCRHTRVQICPVHYGSPALIALKKYAFLEGTEYFSHLLENDIELKISVIFRGRIDTFIQADWDRKMEIHLRKLVKTFPWLARVARYDVQIYWNPVDIILKSSKRNKRVAGQVLKDMLRKLTSLMNQDVRQQKGHVKIVLRVDIRVMIRSELDMKRFGFKEFFADSKDNSDDIKSLTMEIREEKKVSIQQLKYSSPLIVIPKVEEEKAMLVVDKGIVSWARDTVHYLVIRKHKSQKELDKPAHIEYVRGLLHDDILAAEGM